MSATAQHTPDLLSSTGILARLGAALRDSFGRHAAKRMANVANNDPRTIEGWLQARKSPRSVELIRLMAANDELEQQVLALVREIRETHHCPNTLSGSASVGLDTPSATP